MERVVVEIMSSFFRDSNLFATRNNKPLFQTVTSSNKISFEKLGSKHKSTPVVVKPFSDGLKLECSSIGEINSSASLKNSHVLKEEPPIDQGGENEFDNNESSEESITTSNLKISDNPMDEDDDLEITEVRNLDPDFYDGSDNVAETSYTLNNDQDHDHENDNGGETLQNKKEHNEKMDNVSMEYLLGTISHLNEQNKSLQKELKSLKHENEELSSNLKERNESIGILKHSVCKFKCTLENSNALLKDLKVKFIDANSGKNVLSEELKKIKESIHKEHELLYSLKNLVATLKTQNSITESKLAQKVQRIENLEQKANDLAGRLSEEKIKSSQLNKELIGASKKYESDLFHCTEENKKLIQQILDERFEFKTNWAEFVRLVATFQSMLTLLHYS